MALWAFVAYGLVFTVTVISTEKQPAMMDTLDDARLGAEHLALYNDMLKASQDTVGKFEDIDAFYSGTDLAKLKDITDRRRSRRMSSSIMNRRVRSQALRREKLNSQGLRSHIEHSRHSSFEQRVQ